MSYESVVVLFIVFLIPAGVFVVTSIIQLQQDEKAEQTELDMVFSTHKDDSGKFTYR